MKLRLLIVVAIVGSAAFAAVALGAPAPEDEAREQDLERRSRRAAATATPGGITPNARWVAIRIRRDNLPGRSAAIYQVYVRDRKTGKTKLVSKSNSGDPGDDDSYDPTISDDGRFIAFESYAVNLPGSLGRPTTRPTSAT